MRICLIVCITILLICLALSPIEVCRENKVVIEEQPKNTSNGGLMDSAWPMKCHDNNHTGRSPYSTTNNPGIEIWRYHCDWVEGGPVIDNEGTIYFGDFNYYLYALNPNGSLKWKYKTGNWIWSAPAIAEDGTIYVGSLDDYLYAIYPNGTRKWKFHAGDSIASSPAIAEDGTISFGVMGPGWDKGRIYAVNPNGTEKWHYDTGYWIVSDPAIGNDGTIYIGSGDTYFYALWPNGTLRWRFKTGDVIKGPASISCDGTIYIGSFDGYLYAFYPNGTLKWKCNIWLGTNTNPSIAEDGTIYVGSSTKLFAIYPNNGTKKWTFDMGGNIGQSSSAISSDGTIYTGIEIGDVDGGEIVAVNPNGTLRWRNRISNEGWIDSSPAIAADGTIYIGSVHHTGSGYLHAFGIGPLIVDAGGSYEGVTDQEIKFTGTVYGGMPPYSFHWDFGDSNTSDEQNPTHAYSQAGIYTATFTVTDDEGNFSSDNATVTITTSLPSVEITKPEKGLYIANVKVRPYFLLRKPLIIGPISIEAEASQEEVGINYVEFYIDNEFKFIDDTVPYNWIWNTLAFFSHEIKVIAVDNNENSATDQIIVRKLF